MAFQLLLYRVITRRKLIMRFRSYYKMAKWITKNLKESDIANGHYDFKSTKNIR